MRRVSVIIAVAVGRQLAAQRVLQLRMVLVPEHP
jgi:hypothetical protein